MKQELKELMQLTVEYFNYTSGECGVSDTDRDELKSLLLSNGAESVTCDGELITLVLPSE